MICTSIGTLSCEECLNILAKSECAEIRLDLNSYSIAEIRQIFAFPIPLIATCRLGTLNDAERVVVLKTAVESGASMLDLELESSAVLFDEMRAFAQTHGCRVIVSYHNYYETPARDSLEKILDQCFYAGADIAKIACLAVKPADAAEILSLYAANKNIVAISMGEYGKITRLAAPFLGAPFTYASVADHTPTADGQMEVSTLKQLMETLKYA